MGVLLKSDAKAAQQAGLDAAHDSVPLYDESNTTVIPNTGGGAGDQPPDTDAVVDAIEAWVRVHPEDAQRYLDAEEAKDESKQRTTLVASLKAIVDPQS